MKLELVIHELNSRKTIKWKHEKFTETRNDTYFDVLDEAGLP